MLAIKGVSKTYSGGVQALQNINLEVEKGIFGLLGANGAGKSTLMRTLATLQAPDQGDITLDGVDIWQDPLAMRRKIGYLPQDLGVYPRVTAYEMLDYLAGLKGIAASKRAEHVWQLLERVNLKDVAHRRVDTYSGGMRRRFGIASAFIGDPELVIVDEPTAGLDPSERRRFQFLLADAGQHCVLILSSHIVEDIAGLCSAVAVMKQGKIVSSGAPVALTNELSGKVWSSQVSFDQLRELQDELQVLSWRPEQGQLNVRVIADSQPGPKFDLATPDLEDLYSSHMVSAA